MNVAEEVQVWQPEQPESIPEPKAERHARLLVPDPKNHNQFIGYEILQPDGTVITYTKTTKSSKFIGGPDTAISPRTVVYKKMIQSPATEEGNAEPIVETIQSRFEQERMEIMHKLLSGKFRPSKKPEYATVLIDVSDLVNNQSQGYQLLLEDTLELVSNPANISEKELVRVEAATNRILLAEQLRRGSLHALLNEVSGEVNEPEIPREAILSLADPDNPWVNNLKVSKDRIKATVTLPVDYDEPTEYQVEIDTSPHHGRSPTGSDSRISMIKVIHHKVVQMIDRPRPRLTIGRLLGGNDETQSEELIETKAMETPIVPNEAALILAVIRSEGQITKDDVESIVTTRLRKLIEEGTPYITDYKRFCKANGVKSEELGVDDNYWVIGNLGTTDRDGELTIDLPIALESEGVTSTEKYTLNHEELGGALLIKQDNHKGTVEVITKNTNGNLIILSLPDKELLSFLQQIKTGKLPSEILQTTKTGPPERDRLVEILTSDTNYDPRQRKRADAATLPQEEKTDLAHEALKSVEQAIEELKREHPKGIPAEMIGTLVLKLSSR